MSRSPNAARLAETSSSSGSGRPAPMTAPASRSDPQLDEALHLGQEPRRDAGRELQLGGRHAAAEERQEAPQPRVGRRQEALQDERSRGAHGVRVVGADEAVIAHEDLPEELLARDAPAAPIAEARERPGQIVERGAPGRVLGQEARAGLLEAAQRLVERGAEGAVDGHHLAGRLHLRAEPPIGGRELVEREARQLDHDVVERGLEGGHRRPGDRVGDLGEPPADRDLRRHARDGVAGRLGGERRRAADARVDLDDRVVARVGRERELDVAAALDAERPDDGQRRAAQPLVDLVGQRLDGRHDDRVAGVDAERIDVLHRADRDARVVGVAHHLVLDLLPADQALLDDDLADGAGAQARPDALPVVGLGQDDAAARAAERERRPHDRRQADVLERRRRRPLAHFDRSGPRRSPTAGRAGRSDRAGRGSAPDPRPSRWPRAACPAAARRSARARRRAPARRRG